MLSAKKRRSLKGVEKLLGGGKSAASAAEQVAGKSNVLLLLWLWQG
jgi:hypothetical protein